MAWEVAFCITRLSCYWPHFNSSNSIFISIWDRSGHTRKVKIQFLRVIVEAEVDDDQWVKAWLEKLSLISKKTENSVMANCIKR